MSKTPTFDEVLELADHLPLLEKVRLIEHLAPQITRELQRSAGAPRKSLRGVCKGVTISEEDIAEVRHEMWGEFPRGIQVNEGS